MSCGVGRRCGLNSELLWLWHRPAAVAPIQPLDWEPPYAAVVALKSKKKKKIAVYILCSGGGGGPLTLELSIPVFKILVLLISLCVWGKLVKFSEPWFSYQ